MAVAVGAALALVLLVLGSAFANSVGAAQVAENAAALHWANTVSGTSALTRAALTQAVTFAELHEIREAGVPLTTEEEVRFAMEQLGSVTDELRHLLEMGVEAAVTEDLARFVVAVDEATSALEGGLTDEASGLTGSEVETAYQALRQSLAELQAHVQSTIEDNTRTAARVNSTALFFVMLAIPGGAVLTYWSIARRQVRELTIRSESELAAERAISRAKDSFIAGLSHELRTPLTSIYGFAEILTEAGAEPERTAEAARIISDEAAEMTRMVDDLLTASRMESTGLEIERATVGLDDVLGSAIAPFQRAGFEIRWQPSGVTVTTDAPRLRQVLVNLISNATTHGGGEVGVDVTADEAAIDVEVWDSGPGVPEERLSSLFERFAHDGSKALLTGSVGLGLGVASRLTSLLGGKLRYQRFGSKTYFIVSLEADASPAGYRVATTPEMAEAPS